MRTHSDPAALTWPVTARPCVMRSLVSTTVQDTPFQVPIARPIWAVVTGAMLRSVAVTMPDELVLKVNVAAPFSVTVPAKVSVMVGPGVVGVVGVFSPESHAMLAKVSTVTKVRGRNVDLRMHAPATIMPHEMGGTAESGRSEGLL